MNGMYAVSRYIDPLIHKYLVTAFNMRTDDIRLRPLSYNFDVFLHCSNPRHVCDTYILLEHTTVSIVPTPHIFYHSPVYFLL